MSAFDQLKIKSNEVLTARKWNGLVDKLATTELKIPTNKNGEIIGGIEVGLESQTLGLNTKLRVSTKFGTLDIGAQNAGFMHFKTDRPIFHFNKELSIAGGKIGSYNSALKLYTGKNLRIFVKATGDVGIGTDKPVKPLHVHSARNDSGLKITAAGNSKAIYLHLAKNSSGEYGYLDLGGTTRLRGNGKLSEFSGAVKTGFLTVEDKAGQRGYIVVKGHPNDHKVRNVLKTLGKNHLVIAGVHDSGIYFYWNDNKGKHRKLRLGGSYF